MNDVSCYKCIHKQICNVTDNRRVCKHYLDRNNIILIKKEKILRQLGFVLSETEMYYFNEAIKRISDAKTREVEYLYYIKGLTLEEVAETIHYSQRQVERLHVQGKQYIIKCLLEILEEQQ